MSNTKNSPLKRGVQGCVVFLCLYLYLCLSFSVVHAETKINWAHGTIGSGGIETTDTTGDTINIVYGTGSSTITGCGDTDATECVFVVWPSSCRLKECTTKEVISIKDITGTVATIRSRNADTPNCTSCAFAEGSYWELMPTAGTFAGFLQSVASDSDWTVHGSYPPTCANQFIRALGDTNNCASVGIADLASVDFGGFTCNGTTCTLDGLLVVMPVGSVSDCVTDTTNIQAAVDAANGGQVILGPGSFYVYKGSSPVLSITSGIRKFIGSGADKTKIIVCAATAVTTDIIGITPSEDMYSFEMAGFTIYPNADLAGRHAIHIDTTGQKFFTHFYLHNVMFGRDVGYRQPLPINYWTGNDVYLTNPGPISTFYGANFDDNHFSNGIILNNAGDSIDLHKNYFWGKAGLRVDSLISGSNHIHINDNNFFCKDSAIKVNGYRFRIENNNMEPNVQSTGTYAGIWITGGWSTSKSGYDVIRDNSVYCFDGSYAHALYLQQTANVIIDGNYFRGDSTTSKVDALLDNTVAGVTWGKNWFINSSITNNATDNQYTISGPITNTDAYIPQWDGANSQKLKNGLAVGTSANNLVQLDGSAKLPAVDGSQLTNVAGWSKSTTYIYPSTLTDYLGLGTATPSKPLEIVTTLNIPHAQIVTSDTAGIGTGFYFKRGRTASAIVQDGDVLSTYTAAGWDGSVYRNSTAITSEVDGTPGSNLMPGRLIFKTQLNGTGGALERMRITSTGKVHYSPVDNTATPVEPTGSLKFFGYNISLADDATATLPLITTNAYGRVTCGGDNAHYAEFMVGSTGVVTLLHNSADAVANADTDNKLDIGTASTQEPLLIKNRLAETLVCNILLWYD